MKPVICIAGPTASGKSAWAIEVAKSVDGEIINADSMQVYEDLHILSARPFKEEMLGIPHHLYGYVSGKTRYSVGQWLEDVVPVLVDCLARDKTPILVGGTGLYFKALTDGLANIPEPSKEAMLETQALLDSGIDKLRERANSLDPDATAKILGNDPQRLMRVVSVALGTDHPISEWRKNTVAIIPVSYWHGAVLLPEREKLYERINNRYELMLENGGLDEAKMINQMGLDANLPMMKAIGLPPLLDFLKGKISREEAMSQAKRDTRRFAKRQFTWFRGQSKHWFSVNNSNDREEFRQIISQNSI